MPEPIRFDISYSFICPWVYQASLFFQKVNEVHPGKIKVGMKMFSLDQVNNKQGPGWYIWDQPDDYPSKERAAFRAVEAARKQGEEAYDRMHFALLKGRHETRKDFSVPSDIEEIADTAGLDVARWKRDLADHSYLEKLSKEHTVAVKKGVFGTPTYAFENGTNFFLRMKTHENAEDAARAYDLVYESFVLQRNIDEIKRPKPPKD